MTPSTSTASMRMEATLPLISGNRFVDFERYVAANTAFHEYFVGLAKSSALLDVYRRLSIEGIMWRIISPANPS